MKLSSTAYLVLASLREGPLHGYAIRTWMIAALPEDPVPPIATLYATIDRLVEQELVELHDEEVVDGRARRRYRLTSSGLTAAEEEAARLAKAASLMTPRVRTKARPAVAR
jgi:PadR family transcriptional regulator, regulatory protein PadR